jgi:hypothetical protein
MNGGSGQALFNSVASGLIHERWDSNNVNALGQGIAPGDVIAASRE